MTITNSNYIAEMLEYDGRFRGDPAPDSIWQFESTDSGERYFACFYFGQYCDIYDSPFVRNPVLLFFEGEVTSAGKEFLKTFVA
jgi:hypothetical protein